MSSLPRRIQRRLQKKLGTFENKPQPTVIDPDGGYRTLRPTKGWIKVSAKRAQLLKEIQS